jgi:hypothetical protein
MKKCAKCTKEKPLPAFRKLKASSDGHGSYCLECARAYDRTRYARNPEVFRKEKLDLYHRTKVLHGRKKAIDKFEKSFVVDDVSGCWNWIRFKDGNGYGRALWQNIQTFAHRLSWIKYRGPIPSGMVVCHKCDNPACVNPDHLFVGTHADNGADKVAKLRQYRKLTPEVFAAILSSDGTYQEIAKKFDISTSHVGNIKTGKHYFYAVRKEEK